MRQYGEWALEVDIVATQAHYESSIVDESSQCWQNYAKHCQNLLPEEQEFFDSLGIIPEKCAVYSYGMNREGSFYPTLGHYCIEGRFIHKPPMQFKPTTDFTERVPVDHFPSEITQIGRYSFLFLDPDSPFTEFPSDMPDDSICIEFLAENIPWLLNEPCSNRLCYPDMWWQTCKMRKERQFANIVDLFLKNNVEYVWRTGKETVDYMEQWFQHFVPAEKQPQMRFRCFPRYLWHAFECVPSEKGEDACNSYDSLSRQACVVLLNNERLSFVVPNATALTRDIVDGFKDILITDIHFGWTYVHTHEKYCGPYYVSADRKL